MTCTGREDLPPNPTFISIMDTTNRQQQNFYEVLDRATQKLTMLPLYLLDGYCWMRGFTRVKGRQIQLAQTIGFYADEDEPLDLEAVTDEVVDDSGSLLYRKVRRSKKAPFVSWLVATIRGAHLSQCPYTESNVLVFERHARSLMEKHGVRPVDAAKVLPLATATFFFHRTVDQIDGAAIIHAPAFKTSVKKYLAKYYCNGQVAAVQQRA